MAVEIIIEKWIGSLVTDPFGLFKGYPRKDKDGYIVLRIKPSYYGLPIITGFLALICLAALILGPVADDR